MAEDNDYSSYMTAYIHDAANREGPPPVERETLRIITFPKMEFDSKGRAMERPHISILALDRDDKGDYVPVTWGYDGNHHSVSPSVRFKDRRGAMIRVIKENADALRIAETARKRSALESELAEIVSDLDELAKISADQILMEEILKQDISAAELAMKLNMKDLGADDRALIDALLRKDKAELALLAPSLLQKQVEILMRSKERVESLLAPLETATVQQQGETTAVQDIQTLFTSSTGAISETRVHNRVAGDPLTELEIVDTADNMVTPGKFTFVAQGIHSPKGIPLASIALGELLTLSSLQPEGWFGNETIGSSIKKQNGIYRYIHFSSRSGRHSGWGYVAAMPPETSQTK